jgi:hypothetical protein
MWFSRRIALLVSMAVVAATSRAAAAPACEVGAYRGPVGDFVTVYATADTATTGAWRYRFRDGVQGTAPDAAVQCARDAVVVSRGAGAAERWPRIAFRTTATRFRSAGVALAGLLIEPPDAGARPPLVVLGHGSERTPAIDRLHALQARAARSSSSCSPAPIMGSSSSSTTPMARGPSSAWPTATSACSATG